MIHDNVQLYEEHTIAFFAAMRGETALIRERCGVCRGAGARCRKCQGSGVHECDCGHEHDCDACGGTGSGKSQCKACHGKGSTVREARLHPADEYIPRDAA